MNMNRRWLLAAACASLAAPIALGVRGDGKPVIRILVGLPPGGGTDAIARFIHRLPIELGQPVIVENKVGVGGDVSPLTR